MFHLSSLEDDGEAHFVFLVDKFLRMLNFCGQIMFGDARSNANLFYLPRFLMFAGFFQFFFSLVPIFGEIAYFYNRRVCQGGNLQKIFSTRLCKRERFGKRFYSKLSAILVNESDFTSANFLVNSRDLWLSDGFSP